jgi:hypothetical protein
MAPFEIIPVKMVASNLDLSLKIQYEFCKSRSAPFEFFKKHKKMRSFY